MKMIIKPNDKHSLYNIKKVITSAIERSGFNIVSKGGCSFGIMELDKDGQIFVRTIVSKKCEQYGLEYEIND
tara:strand:+ start:261 stop:476 length:216 start_codon:yes stop_codon:yes gene_type:complete